MPFYVYVKENKAAPKPSPFSRWHISLDRTWRRRASWLTLFVGFFLLANGFYPIISYQIRYAPRFTQIQSPVPEKFAWHSPLVSAKDDRDYTLISSWFVERPELSEMKTENQIFYYTLDIPSLGIKNATIHIGGDDLKRELVQYANTALPGELGNTVIFGHSVLPQFFDPGNYLTIFSTLYRLKEGSEINVFFDGVKYVYKVEDIFEVTPTDLSVLSQNTDGKRLTLITCSPPGTYLRRLVVRSRLFSGSP